jgi:hypothetical protein
MNLKTGGIAAAAGFVLSLIIGLIFGNGVFAIPRALGLALFFFVLVNVIIVVTRRFLPELLDSGAEQAGAPRPGSMIDIFEGSETVDTPGMEADIENPDFRQVPGGGDSGLAVEPDLSGERFSERNGPGADISGPLDLTGKDNYNEKKSDPGADTGLREDQAGDAFNGAGFLPLSAPPLAAGSAAPSGDGASADTLPDFGAMSRAFLPPDGKAGEDGNGAAGEGGDVFHLSIAGQSPEPSPKYYKGSKSVEMKGDFPPQKIARAIQTILKHDE